MLRAHALAGLALLGGALAAPLDKQLSMLVHQVDELEMELDMERTPSERDSFRRLRRVCRGMATAMDKSFPYHGSEHSRTASRFVESIAPGFTGKAYSHDNPGLIGVLKLAARCHDVGYAVAAKDQGFNLETVGGKYVAAETKPQQPGYKLGLAPGGETGGHEAKSIIEAIKAFNAANLAEEIAVALANPELFVSAIAGTKLGSPEAQATERTEGAKGAGYPADHGAAILTAADGDNKKYMEVMEASDFAAYTTDGVKGRGILRRRNYLPLAGLLRRVSSLRRGGCKHETSRRLQHAVQVP
jgi:hypothetical protein